MHPDDKEKELLKLNEKGREDKIIPIVKLL